MTVTFETKCWQGDWQYLLLGGCLERIIDNCNFNFTEKILYINNVDNLAQVKRYADRKVQKGIIDKYIVVEEYAQDALNFFGINTDDFKGGYYYSIAELVSLYLCKTDYLLHFSSDSYIVNANNNWVSTAIDALSKNEKYIVANPLWDHDYEAGKRESFDETDDFFYRFWFFRSVLFSQNERF